MMRVCNLDTCPVGIATNNPELRKKFTGKPEYVVNFMQFVAQELREIMASLGFRTVNEMIGRSDMLELDNAKASWKAKGLDLSALLYKPAVPAGTKLHQSVEQNHGLENTLDMSVLLKLCESALADGSKVEADLPIQNTDRAVGTILGSFLTRKYGFDGLPEDTIKLNFTGSSGQSFGAFVPKGITLTLTGDANDYTGKGLSGGRIIVKPPAESTFVPEDNIIIGNVAFYGATGGEAYIRGAAGERFCVRNSGVRTVVEAVGDHGCEYMTGGRVVVLGETGRNFGAGMSGGVAYVYDGDGTFPTRFNREMADIIPVDDEGAAELKQMISEHLKYTGSSKAKAILADWDNSLKKFRCIMPNDYKRMMQAIKQAYKDGHEGDEALMIAFDANNRDVSRLSGN
jgi:glutamate synthase (ferredoxin)